MSVSFPQFPTVQRFLGAAALGTALWGVGSSAYHGVALLHPAPLEDPAPHRKALLRDLAFLAVSLPALAYVRAARRFAERPELRFPSMKTGPVERDDDLIHVIASPSAEDTVRVRDLEEAYYDVCMDWWSEPTYASHADDDMGESLATIQRALLDWERKKNEGDDIGRTEALLKLARLNLRFSVLLSLSGRQEDGDMYEKSASLQMRVVGAHLESLSKNVANRAESRRTSAAEKDMAALRARMVAVIDFWGLLPGKTASAEKARTRLEALKSEREEKAAGETGISAVQRLFELATAYRDYAFAVRYEGRTEAFWRALADASRTLKRARRLLRSLERP